MLRSRDSGRTQAKQRTTGVKSIPAPVGGWNERDSIANMKSHYAVVLENWFPQSSDIQIRQGSAEHATGLGAQVETLMPYRPVTGSHKIFGIAGGKIYNATAVGAVGAADVSGLTNSRWQHINFTTSGGNYLIAVNGVDNMELYDGTTWTTITGASSPAITGLATTLIADVNVHKQRVWYVETASLSAWYTAAGSFAGTVTEFPLGAVFSEGGSLVSMNTWTLDAGSGVDDLAVFITSNGEVAIYAGTDPASANTWELIGVFKIGAPIGQRCLRKYGAELLAITVDGVLPLSNALFAGRVEESSISEIIRGAVDRAVELYRSNFGWELTHYPEASMLVLNVPNSVGLQEQYVMNTVTNAWCKFKGWGANTFELHNDDLYFGGDGVVYKAWTGQQDDGINITADVCSAFSYYGKRGENKKFNMVRPIISREGDPVEVRIAMNTDLNIESPTAIVTFPEVSTGDVWGTGDWTDAVWSGGHSQLTRWFDVQGLGLSAAPHLAVETDRTSVRLSSFDIAWVSGGLL